MALSLKPFEETPPRKNLMIIGEGLEKTGKTDFTLKKGVRRPVVFMSIDRPAEYLFRKHGYNAKTLLLGDYRMRTIAKNEDPNKVAEDARPIWQRFWTDFHGAIAPAHPSRTIVVDSSTTLYALGRLAEFGKLTQVPPIFYQRINDKLQRLCAASLACSKDVIFTARLTEEWAGPKDKQEKTGRLIRDGWKSLGYEAEVTVRFSITKDNEYTAAIVASAYGGLGEEFEGEEINLANVRRAVLSTGREE